MSKINSVVLYVFLILAMMAMISDLIVTAKALNTLTIKVDSLVKIIDDMRQVHSKFKVYEEEEFLHKLKLNPEGMIEKLKVMSLKYDDLDIQQKMDEMQVRFKSLKEKATVHRRLLNAFPNMKSTHSVKRDSHFQYMKKMLKEKK